MKKLKTVTTSVAFLVIATACVPQSEHDDALNELESVRSELVSTKLKLIEALNGKQNLIDKVLLSIRDENFDAALEALDALRANHPSSSKDVNYKEFEQQISDGREKQKKIQSLNDTGMWKLNEFVDDFGEPSGKFYITNGKPLVGTFENSATTGAALGVQILITNTNDNDGFALKLYEYNRRHPVKGTYSNSTFYSVLVRGTGGDQVRVRASNSSDRFTLTTFYREKIWKEFTTLVLKGGKLSFLIEESGNNTKYRFSLENSNGLSNALGLIKLKATGKASE